MRNLYDHHFTLKPGTRVYVPTDFGRDKGDGIKAAIESLWKPPANYFHLLGGGHVAAVKQHRNAVWLASLDLQRFFDQITRTKVHRALKAIGLPHEEAWEMACDSTVDKAPPKRQFSLPFGFVQSPIVASVVLAHSALGVVIRKLVNDGLTVTVYVDDITISGLDRNAVECAVTRLEAGAELAGFAFNPAKTQPPNSKVTSFNIEFGSGGMKVLQERMAEFEAALHLANEHRIGGILGYVGTVNPSQADKLAEGLPDLDQT
ncbi:MAG: reverse transcriptase domain-containing protein [Sphingomonadaceae bacterium]